MKLINNFDFSRFKYKNFFAYFFVSILGPLVNILINPILAKNLSHLDYTIIGYFTSFNLLIVPLFSFNFITYFLKSNNDRNIIINDEFKSTILVGITIIGLISLLIISLIFSVFISNYKNISYYPNGFYCFAQLYLSSFFTLFLLKLRLENNVREYTIYSILYVVIYTFSTIFFVVFLKNGAEGKFFSSFIVSVFFALMSFKLFKRKIRLVLNKDILIKAFKFGIPLTISSIFWYFLVGIDRLFLIEINDPIKYGNYVVAIQISGYMGIFYTSLNNTFETDIFKMISDNQYNRLIKVYILIMCLIIFLNLLLYYFSPLVINFLTAGRYNDSIEYLKILCFMNISMVAYYLSIKLLIANGFVKTELLTRIISAIISIILFKVLINSYGFKGAAWGQVISFIVATLIATYSFYLRYKKNKIYDN